MPQSNSHGPENGARPRAGSLRAVPLEAGSALPFTFDGEPLEAAPGETISVALYAAGRQVLRTTARLGEPRGIFCNMGVCFDCLVEVDGQPNLRACQTPVRAGMQVRTQHGHGLHRVTEEWKR